MKEHVYVLRNNQDRDNLANRMMQANIESPIEVVVRKFEKNRSKAQNRLSFMWYLQRAKHFHTTADYEHRFCKLRYGCPILIAADPDFAEIYRMAIEPLDYEKRISAMKFLPVTRLMKVKQMADYMNEIEGDSHNQGVMLTHPEDLYLDAMGAKK